MKLIIGFVLALILVVTIIESKHHHGHKKRKSTIVHRNDAVPGVGRSFSMKNETASNDELDSSRRTVYEALEEEFPTKVKETIVKAFKKLVGTMLNPPADENALDSAKESLVEVLKVYQKSGGDIFKQVQVKMKISPSDFYKTIVGQNKESIADMLNSKTISKEKWIMLRDTKYRFLPSQKHYSSSEYTKDFFPDIVAYAMVFVATTMDLTFTGDVYRCQLSKELDLFRNDIEIAVQASIYKRLNMLKPHSSDWRWIDTTALSGRDKINYKDAATGKLLCEGGCVLNDGEGKKPVDDAIMGIAVSVIDDATAMLDFMDRLFALLVEKAEFCFESCICPPDAKAVSVERGDYVKDFPWSCLGKPTDDQKKICKLPCGTYGESYNWCPTKLNTRASPWAKCTLANQETCVQGWYKK